MPDSTDKIIVALDFADRHQAEALVARLDPSLCKLKIGKELFTRAGPDLVRAVVEQGYDVFLDLKFHDIPNTTARAVAAAADLGVWMVNVHASGGQRMMEAAAQQLQGMGVKTLLTAVTVLTSMSEDDLRQIGIDDSTDQQVLRLATLARDSGVDGVVCSPLEAAGLAAQLGNDFLRVTPGVRPADAGADDQRRTMTPAQALANGSSYLVIGRPITRAASPRDTLLAIREEIGNY
ncbi:MAG: orotidine-5'-phosphate decarboxylase [Porticoccaceae bacterium]|nr:orotidine-5'-phosphate decarboxylase [Porticoccaceae bacterium]